MQGIVVEVKGKNAILLTDSGEFTEIKNNGYEIGQKIKRKPVSYSFAAGIAACFLLVCTMGFSGYALYNTPASYISIDINPSLSATINRFDRVIAVKSLNGDAQTLLRKVTLKHKSTEQMIQTVVNTAKELGYLSKDHNEVDVSIVSGDKNLTKEIEATVSEYEKNGITVSVEKATESELKLANQLQISVGRTRALLEYSDRYDVSVEESAALLSDATVGEIKKAVNAKETNKSEKNTDSNKADKQQTQSSEKSQVETSKPINEADGAKNASAEKKQSTKNKEQNQPESKQNKSSQNSEQKNESKVTAKPTFAGKTVDPSKESNNSKKENLSSNPNSAIEKKQDINVKNENIITPPASPNDENNSKQKNESKEVISDNGKKSETSAVEVIPSGQAKKEDGQSTDKNNGKTPNSSAVEVVPPGQAKKEDNQSTEKNNGNTVTAEKSSPSSDNSAVEAVSPGQAKNEVDQSNGKNSGKSETTDKSNSSSNSHTSSGSNGKNK